MTNARRLLNQPQLRMPKSPDSLGIVFKGPVLRGKQSVQAAQLGLKAPVEYPSIPGKDSDKQRGK